MQSMKNKIEIEAAPKQKERHIVTWTQQEDDTLREQINSHGTLNWAIIASKFTDKTTRQCRRRWYTYLNSDFKKGGWSPEEDMLLCEAQKIYGNRWTEIAKVVSGRTDNAVKNRFTTLCKKRAKHEALTKENNTPFINLNNKRVLLEHGLSTDKETETATPFKKMRRAHITSLTENCNGEEKVLRPPFAVLAQNFANTVSTEESSNNAQRNNKNQGAFLQKDDPKINALLQQAELLSSLAIEVNTAHNTDQCLENAWKVLQDYLDQTKESDTHKCNNLDMDFEFQVLRDLIEDLQNGKERSLTSWRQPNLHDESSGRSEYNTESTLLFKDKTDICVPFQYIGPGTQSVQSKLQNVDCGSNSGVCISPIKNQEEVLPGCDEQKDTDEVFPTQSPTACLSPLVVTPMFRPLAGIPSPTFSESERNFLMKTLGVESPSMYLRANPPQPPLCKRALLQSL